MTPLLHHTHLCVHGHFYQPPREDPLTKAIPPEPGAEPFLSWNQRIMEECYRPNAMLGNFSKISFNLGPTLAGWLNRHAPDVLERIVGDENKNFKKFGTGNGLAQPYHHTILPLGDFFEKSIQIAWGIKNFEYYFHHRPEGMWLPETAVDNESLSIMADQGIKFTILAPWQIEVLTGEGGSPARVDLPNGKAITVFPYDSPLSSQVSFDNTSTENAERFSERIASIRLSDDGRRFVLIATDGELYGHHQPFRDMFLSHLLNGASTSRGITPIYPGLWLKDNEVRTVARIRESTSWSCHHGIERWRSECECSSNTSWKPAFTKGLRFLAGEIDRLFKEGCLNAGIDPVSAFEDYIDVELERTTFSQWIRNKAVGVTSVETLDQLHKLFQAQLYRQRMFTSCAWFFGNLERLEPQYALKNAAYATWLIRAVTGTDLSQSCSSLLDDALMPGIKRTAGSDYRQYFEGIEHQLPVD